MTAAFPAPDDFSRRSRVQPHVSVRSLSPGMEAYVTDFKRGFASVQQRKKVPPETGH